MPASETIPEDVLKAAELAQDAAIERCKLARLSVADYPFASGAAKDVLDDEIARAILSERARATAAERESCARVARKMASDLKVNDLSARKHGATKEAEGYAYAADRCIEIEAAIRSGDHNAS